MNVQKMMEQVQKMQAEMTKAQQALAEKTVEASAGGGAVTVTANGHQQILSIKIDPAAVDPDDVENAAGPGLGCSQRGAAKVTRDGQRGHGPGDRRFQHSRASRLLTQRSASPMVSFVRPIARLVEELTKLPGIGPKTAQRLALHIVAAPREDVHALADAIVEAREKTIYCSICCNLTDIDPCRLCTREGRGPVCVVRGRRSQRRDRPGAHPGV